MNRSFVLVVLTSVMMTACSAEEEQQSEDPFECHHVIPESVSCGYPIYLEDGTRIERHEHETDV